MKKNKIKFFALILCFIMLISVIPAYASTFDERSSKLLYIVDSAEYDTLENQLNTPSIIIDESKSIDYYDDEVDLSESIIVDFSLFDYISSDDVTLDLISKYKGIALSVNAEYTTQYAAEAYNTGVLVYLYGELTISEYTVQKAS